MQRLNILLCSVLVTFSCQTLGMDEPLNDELSSLGSSQTPESSAPSLISTTFSGFSAALGSASDYLNIGLTKKSRQFYTAKPEYMDKLIGFSDDDLDSQPIDRPLFEEIKKTNEHYSHIRTYGLAGESNIEIHVRPYEKRLGHAIRCAHALMHAPHDASTAYKIFRLLEFNAWILPEHISKELQKKHQVISEMSEQSLALLNLKTVFATKRAIELIKQDKEDRIEFVKILIDMHLACYGKLLAPSLKEQLLDKKYPQHK